MRQCHGARGPGSIRRAGNGRRTSVVESVPSSSLRYMPAHTSGRDGARAEQLARAAKARHTCGLSELRAGRREEGRVVEGEGGDASAAVTRARQRNVRHDRLGVALDELNVSSRGRDSRDGGGVAGGLHADYRRADLPRGTGAAAEADCIAGQLERARGARHEGEEHGAHAAVSERYARGPRFLTRCRKRVATSYNTDLPLQTYGSHLRLQHAEEKPRAQRHGSGDDANAIHRFIFAPHPRGWVGGLRVSGCHVTSHHPTLHHTNQARGR